MPNYQYMARDQRGNSVSGTLAAPNPEALADQLRRMGYLVTKSQEHVDTVPLPDDVCAWLQAFTDEHYRPEPKQRKRPASFRAPGQR